MRAFVICLVAIHLCGLTVFLCFLTFIRIACSEGFCLTDSLIGGMICFRTPACFHSLWLLVERIPACSRSLLSLAGWFLFQLVVIHFDCQMVVTMTFSHSLFPLVILLLYHFSHSLLSAWHLFCLLSQLQISVFSDSLWLWIEPASFHCAVIHIDCTMVPCIHSRWM